MGWDKDSVISPREFEEPGDNDEEVSFQDEESIEDEHAFDASFRHVEQDVDLSTDTSVEEEEEDQEIEDELQAQIIADCESGEDAIEDELSVDSEDEESDVEEEEEKEVSLTFHCDDDVSKISFMGQPVLEDESVKSELLGESFIKRQSIDVISSSYQGNRITDVSTMNHGQISQFTAPVQQKKKKSALKKFMGSLNCVKHAIKPSRAAEAYTDAYEEIGKKHSWETAKQPLKSIYDSPGSKSGMGGYLPGQYMNTNNNAGVAPYSKSRQVPESPMSLASAYRRQLSPGSSLMSGFTDVEACVMKRSNDIGQHVQHLKSVFKSPVRVNEPRKRSLYRPFE